MFKEAVLLSVVHLLSLSVFCQNGKALEIRYEPPKNYEIGALKVRGAKYSDEKTILSMASFQLGDRIRIPGPKTSRSLKTLMNQGL